MTSSAGGQDAVPHRVTAVVPVKQLALAKSRLAVPADQRQVLALAFAVDTISSMCASPLVAGVLVVTSDAVVARRVRRLEARVTPDEGAGLGQAVRAAIRVAAAWRPGTGVAVVPADLPCLRSEDVTQVVTDASGAPGAFVPDRSGTGTTFVVYPPGRRALTCYGPGSAARHGALGLRPLEDAPLGARQDVDTLDDLVEAGVLGPGAETLAAVEALGFALGRCPR